ncbi:MAG: ribonuclease III [Nitrospinae bacterium]|nr:ribonuclease III [Nitrospinota bacterium]
MEDERTVKLKELATSLGLAFKDISLLNKALTHRSYANERQLKSVKDNERLEFLGDSVLDLVVSRYLFFQGLHMREGELSRIRSQIVNEQSLARFARSIHLGEYLLLGRGEEGTGGREKNSLLANAMEALIAAIYLDSSFGTAYQAVLNLIKEELDKAAVSRMETDYKGLLQKQAKNMGAAGLQYKLVEEQGPDHDKLFKVQVWMMNEPFGTGEGRTKKEAEQAAAQATCEMLGANNPGQPPVENPEPADERH